MQRNLQSLTVLGLATAMSVSVFACKKNDQKKDARKRKVTVNASIAEFDPNEDIVLDLDKFGSERVDEYELEQAFYGSFDGIDRCIAETKSRHKIADGQIDGSLTVAIKLNPQGAPFGINADLSSAKWNGDEQLKDCVKTAINGVNYPKWDGPPQVAEFEIEEFDPGWDYE